jgi:hypothetical protein
MKNKWGSAVHFSVKEGKENKRHPGDLFKPAM